MLARSEVTCVSAARQEAAGRRLSLGCRARQFHDRLYDRLCGTHPNLRPWHFQWLAARGLYRDLRRVLPQVAGRVLDVGCGSKPYAGWINSSGQRTTITGVDIAAGPGVDLVIDPEGPWPLESAAYDAVICTQVLEHVRRPERVVEEIARVAKPGACVIVSVPFIYSVHGAPNDYRRFSVHGLREMFERSFEIAEPVREGGIGSSLGLLWLNWLFTALQTNRVTIWLKVGLLPVWIAISALTNLAGWLLDQLDRTDAFYSNVLAVATRR